ncbi:MAG: hypothetical protein JXR04_02655 [Bermanella sp.]
MAGNNSRLGLAILFTGLSVLIYFYTNWFYYMREVSEGMKPNVIEILFYPVAPQLAFLISIGTIGKGFLVFYMALLFVGHFLLQGYRFKIWDIRFYDLKELPDSGVVSKSTLNKYRNLLYLYLFGLPAMGLLISIKFWGR